MASCNGLPFLLNMIHIYRSAFSKYLLTVKNAKAQENQRFSMVTKLKLCALKRNRLTTNYLRLCV